MRFSHFIRQSEGRIKLYLDRESEILPPIFHMKNWFFEEILQQNRRKYSVQFNRLVMSISLWPHGLQHTRLPCPSPTPRAYSNSCSSSWWCLSTFSSSVVPFFSHLQSFPSIRVFSNESVLRFRWPKYWNFSISSSKEYSGLISFRMDWFDLLVSKGLSRVFSNTIIQNHQFFSAQLSL